MRLLCATYHISHFTNYDISNPTNSFSCDAGSTAAVRFGVSQSAFTVCILHAATTT